MGRIIRDIGNKLANLFGMGESARRSRLGVGVAKWEDSQPCEDNFKNLLKLIAASLSLNKITLDLQSSNVEIKNPASCSEENARAILKIYVDGLSNGEVNKRLDELAKDVVFKNYTQLVKEFRRSEAYEPSRI